MYYVQQLPLNYNVSEDQALHGVKLHLKPCWSSMTIKHFLELVGYIRGPEQASTSPSSTGCSLYDSVVDEPQLTS